MFDPARGIVGRVADCRVRGLRFKSPGLILTSRTETSSLSRVDRDGWDPYPVPLSGGKKSRGGVFDLAVEQPQLFRKILAKKKTNFNFTTLMFSPINQFSLLRGPFISN